MKNTRRDFLNHSTIIATSAVASGLTMPGRIASANDTVRLGIMGLRNRGQQLAREFARCKNCEVTMICDVDSRLISPVQDLVEKLTGKRPASETDFRKMLEGDKIDALVVAAPDHWHAIATIYACQAGKDVYCEKPASHNLTEGRLMVKAARKYNRVVQLGTQRRSSIALQNAMKGLEDGIIGDVHMARAWIVSRRPNIGHLKNGPAPKEVNYDLWLGPAPKREFNPNHFHYEWHWFWEYGTGECGNNGIHALDLARWGLGVDFPKRACAGGGKRFFDDDQQTPDTQLATFDFDDVTITWEHRTWNPYGFDGKTFGVIFYGVDGVLSTDGADWKAEDFDGEVIEQQKASGGNHYQNFIDCVQCRERPNADIEIGHKSTALCHIANIAYRTRLNVEFDGEAQKFVGLGADQANALLRRTYREPFVLTEDV